MITRRILLGVLVFAALLAGCEDEFLTGASITRMRLLGAKLSINGDAERARLRPGDDARVDFQVALPPQDSDDTRANPLRDVRSMILHCAFGAAPTGQPTCAETLFLVAQFQMLQGGGNLPELDEATVRAAVEALGRGVGCDADEPANDPDDLNPLSNAASALASAAVTSQAARLYCPGDLDNGRGNPLTNIFTLDDAYQTEPADSPYLGADRLVQGVICEYGEPYFKLDAPFFGCRYEIGSDPTLPMRAPTAEVFFYTLGIEQDGISNNHPAFGEPALSIAADNPPVEDNDFDAWTGVTTRPASNCAGVTSGGDVLVRDFGDKSVIRVRVEEMRELIGDTETSTKRENYQVESFSTAGELDRQFSVYDDQDTTPVIEVAWDHGARPRRNGASVGSQRADFYFLIRDGRGGLAFETRSICLCADNRCPPAP